MSERSPMYEPFKQEQKQKKEKKARFGGIIDKVIIGGAVVGTLAAGTVGYEKYVAPHNEKIMKDYDSKLDEKIKEEDALQELVNDPRTGYVDMEHYLADPESDKNPEKLEEMRKYFEAREEK